MKTNVKNFAGLVVKTIIDICFWFDQKKQIFKKIIGILFIMDVIFWILVLFSLLLVLSSSENDYGFFALAGIWVIKRIYFLVFTIVVLPISFALVIRGDTKVEKVE